MSGFDSFLVRDGASGMYAANSALLSEEDILAAAEEILLQRMKRECQFRTVEDVVQYLWVRLNSRLSEVFAVVFLDASLQVLAYEEMFHGTISLAYVHPREVVRRCLHHNAAKLIIAHNHPSGDSTPSDADKKLTASLQAALLMFDVHIVDHIVVGRTCTSFAASGLLRNVRARKSRR